MAEKKQLEKGMKISLIIAFYKNLPALELIFLALERQSFRDFEVIIAEDDCSEISQKWIETARQMARFSIKHVWQSEKKGFRKTKILNAAVAVAAAEKLVFIDGDCLPHRHFLKMHDRFLDEKTVLFGRRVMLGPTFSAELLAEKKLTRLSFFQLLKTDSTRLKYGLFLPFLPTKKAGIWGCNWSIFKKNMARIGGFDEKYEHAGVGEDVDIEWRLRQLGDLDVRSIRFAAIVFHLYHPSNYDSADVEKGFEILNAKKIAA